MKTITITYVGYYTKDFDVPDDFTMAQAFEFSNVEQSNIDFSDGGADWSVYTVDMDGKTELNH